MMVRAQGKEFDIQAVAFDKDGLLFESRSFWLELGRSRAYAMAKHLPPEQTLHWLDFFGVKAQFQNRQFQVLDVDPLGIMAIAARWEELTVTAGFLVEHAGYRWAKAREAAQEIFRESDEGLRLFEALKPRPGFPAIFQKLRELGIPYGIATSDTRERAIASVDRYDDASALSFLITPQEVSVGKPHPEMLLTIAQQLGISPEKILMLGDSYVDVLMARRAGAVGIGIPEQDFMIPEMEPYASAILSSLEELEFFP